MRQIESSGLDTEEWRTWLADCETETQINIDLVERGEKIAFTSLYKRQNIKDDYFFSPGEPFYGKCAYCETPIEDIFPGDVEHFRPKGKVTDEEYNDVFKQDSDGSFLLDTDGNKIPHPGYYWLAYNWKNLMPSCTYCNRPKKDFGKRNCFPVEGVHTFTVGDEDMEKPLLINPIDINENPEAHFSVDFDTGVLIAKSMKGKKTIDLLGLNKRRYLREGRLQAINNAKAQLTKLIYNIPQRQEALDEIEQYKNGNRSYSFAFVSFINDFLNVKGLLK